ncbi:MAG: hypothetical protein JSV80_05690, partial [Acidobacteriota bacterium]
MRIDVSSVGKGRLSRRLLGAFFLIVAVLAVAGMMVATQITAQSLEARAESQLLSDEAIVGFHFGELEKQVTLFSELLADAEMLTDHLGHPSIARSLTISLLGSLRRNQMQVQLYRAGPESDSDRSMLVRKGFLGIRSTALTNSGDSGTRQASIESTSPIESATRVERVVSVSFPLTSAYLEEVRARIGSDITLMFTDDHVISTIPTTDLTSLLAQLREQGLADDFEDTMVLAASLSTGPTKTRVSPFRVNTRREGLLLLTIPMGDLLAAKRTIFFKGLLVTAIIL